MVIKSMKSVCPVCGSKKLYKYEFIISTCKFAEIIEESEWRVQCDNCGMEVSLENWKKLKI